MNPGTVILDKEFEFSDGTKKPKYLVILNDGANGQYIAIKTTSQPEFKSRNPGCQSNKFFSCFYLPKGSCCMPGNTWLMLNDLHHLEAMEMIRGKFSHRIEHIGELPPVILKDLLDCTIDSEDITAAQQQILIDVRNSL